MYTKFMSQYKHLGLTRVKGEAKKFLLVNNTNENILFQMQSISCIMLRIFVIFDLRTYEK